MSDPNTVPPLPQQPEPTPERYTGAMPPPLPTEQTPAAAPVLPEFIAGPADPGPPAAAHAASAAPVVPNVPVQYTAPVFEMPSPRVVDYQYPETRPAGSQWATDDQAYGGCMIYALLVLTA